jgi:hypothetical protein
MFCPLSFESIHLPMKRFKGKWTDLGYKFETVLKTTRSDLET